MRVRGVGRRRLTHIESAPLTLASVREDRGRIPEAAVWKRVPRRRLVDPGRGCGGQSRAVRSPGRQSRRGTRLTPGPLAEPEEASGRPEAESQIEPWFACARTDRWWSSRSDQGAEARRRCGRRLRRRPGSAARPRPVSSRGGLPRASTLGNQRGKGPPLTIALIELLRNDPRANRVHAIGMLNES